MYDDGVSLSSWLKQSLSLSHALKERKNVFGSICISLSLSLSLSTTMYDCDSFLGEGEMIRCVRLQVWALNYDCPFCFLICVWSGVLTMKNYYVFLKYYKCVFSSLIIVNLISKIYYLCKR